MTSCWYCLSCLLVLTSPVTGRIVDLSHKQTPQTIPAIFGQPKYKLTNLSKALFPGFYVETNYIGTNEHSGTHIDAPSHFVRGAAAVDSLPLEYLVLPGVMIDSSQEAAKNQSYVVTVQKLQEWERVHGKIHREAAVLFYFGWYQKFENENLYRGTTDPSNYLTYVYPSVSLEAARWLLVNRSVRMMGSDTLTVDPFQVGGQFSGLPIHRLLLPLNRLLVENLRDLDRLPARGFTFHAAPVKYLGASATQVRAYAILSSGYQ